MLWFGIKCKKKNNSSNLCCYPCAKIFYKWLKSIDYIQQYLRCIEVIYITESVPSFLLRRMLGRHIFWQLLKLQKQTKKRSVICNSIFVSGIGVLQQILKTLGNTFTTVSNNVQEGHSRQQNTGTVEGLVFAILIIGGKTFLIFAQALGYSEQGIAIAKNPRISVAWHNKCVSIYCPISSVWTLGCQGLLWALHSPRTLSCPRLLCSR